LSSEARRGEVLIDISETLDDIGDKPVQMQGQTRNRHNYTQRGY
jgi:hypothetical protein